MFWHLSGIPVILVPKSKLNCARRQEKHASSERMQCHLLWPPWPWPGPWPPWAMGHKGAVSLNEKWSPDFYHLSDSDSDLDRAWIGWNVDRIHINYISTHSFIVSGVDCGLWLWPGFLFFLVVMMDCDWAWAGAWASAAAWLIVTLFASLSRAWGVKYTS